MGKYSLLEARDSSPDLFLESHVSLPCFILCLLAKADHRLKPDACGDTNCILPMGGDTKKGPQEGEVSIFE